jgi:hypothetical protein
VNKVRKIILLSGAALQLIMLLFPPSVLHVSVSRASVTANGGYSFIFAPCFIDAMDLPIVNVGLLAVQAAVVALITGLLYLAFAESRAESSRKEDTRKG